MPRPFLIEDTDLPTESAPKASIAASPDKAAYEAFVISKLLRMTLQGVGGETRGEIELAGAELDAFMSGLFMLEERVASFYATI